MVDKIEAALVLPNTCLRMVSKLFKEMEEDTFSKDIESLVAAVVTKVDPRENFP